MQSARFSIAIHILTLLARSEGELTSSEVIAGSININPVLVRKELINLREHHFVGSREGKNGGSYLLKSASEIYLSDVYRAVNQSALLSKSKNKPNPACRVGRQINSHLDRLFADAEKAMITQLEKMSLKRFAAQFH
jgi:Rrf2 family protein